MASVAHKKRWDSVECSVKAACDGNSLRGKRIESGICATCEKTLAERGKIIKPRGIPRSEQQDE